MKILFAGIIARYPFGGVTWCSLMYLLGLRALGHEVLYIEDTGECIYDPERDEIATDPAYGTRYIHEALEPFGLGDRWSFVNYDGSYHGLSRDAVRAYCAEADLFVNLSGGSWFWRDEYAAIPRRVFNCRCARYDVMRQRCGYCPVEIAVRDGEQIGEFT